MTKNNTFIDLFCGIGGFRLALEKQGLQCVFSSEIDTHARASYQANFGELPHGDITKIDAKDIPAHDVLCAGFPCQPFSVSGKRLGQSDSRGTLFNEILRIAKHHQPKVLLLENVRGILTIDNGAMYTYINNSLMALGYTIHISVLNAAHFGVPQSRVRAYFVCLRRDLGLTYHEAKPTFEPVCVGDAIGIKVPVDVKKLKPIRTGIIGKGGQGERIYGIHGVASTQCANGGGGGAKTGLYDTPEGIRKLSNKEALAVMGFPESHHISQGTQGYKQTGNAVVPRMIELVYGGIEIK